MRGYNCREKIEFTEQQLIFALKQAETGVPVAEACRKPGISEPTFYNAAGSASSAVWARQNSGGGVSSKTRTLA